MSELKLVCQHLDRIITEYFTTQDEFLAKQQQLEKEMRDGLFLMAKARYTMGTKSVSALQYHLDDMTATHKVRLIPTDPVLEQDNQYMTFDPDVQLGSAMNNSTKKPMEEETKGEEGGSAEGLRRRNVADKESEKDDSDISEVTKRIQELDVKEKPTSPTKPSPASNDPLRWFGVLVPQALRESQKSFRSVTTRSCEVASLKAKLVNYQVTIRKLLRRKEDIIGSVDDSGFVIYDESSFLSSMNSSQADGD